MHISLILFMCLFVLIIYCPHIVNAISRSHNNDFACAVLMGHGELAECGLLGQGSV